MSSTPQTVSFQVEFSYADLNKTKFRVFNCFDEMMKKIRTEKKRRARADRATGVRYKNVLTDHGRAFYGENYGRTIVNDEKLLSAKLGVTIGEWMNW